MAKRYAPVTSTRQDDSISESLKHELNQNFVQKRKKKIHTAKIWAPVHCNIFLDTLVVVAHARWKVVFQRLLRHLMSYEEAGIRTSYTQQTIPLHSHFKVRGLKVIWFACVGLMPQSVVYANGTT